MDTLQLNQTLSNAFEAMNLAENELCKPSEDVVTPLACMHVRNAAEYFLRAYLISVSQNPTTEKTFNELINLCANTDKTFASIDLSCFTCKQTCVQQCESKYCLSVAHLATCFNKTQMVRSIVQSKIKLTTNDYE